MATATATPSKSSFVEKFLKENPQGNVAAVNAAWQAAGMKGTIGASLIQDKRARMGLVGNLRGDSKPKTAVKKKSASQMSKSATTPNKTGFVQEFLRKNPQGNTKAVNEAWTAAGMKGTISHPVISRVRQELGLIDQPGKIKAAAKAKSATTISRPPVNPGKSMFVKEFLNDHPQANVAAVNKAWQSSGFEGTVSPTLVHHMRGSLGLAGNLRGNMKGAAAVVVEKPGKEPVTTVKVQPQGNGAMALNDLEAAIDRLMFKVMGVGDLTEIEETLRHARRLLYAALHRG